MYFELLQIIPSEPQEWENAIRGIRAFRFPTYTKIRVLDRRLIEELLIEDPKRRPRIAEVCQFIGKQIEIEVSGNGTFIP